jgi:hypothetical protein
MRQKWMMLVIFQLMFFAATESRAQIVINEILASNTSANIHPENKNFVDWLELYNASDKELSIGCWYLSDNKNKPDKWKIPFNFKMEAKGYKIFWFDKEGRADYKNFMLHSEGDCIYLFDRNLVMVDSLSYTQQASDISYGRLAGSTNQLAYFQEATAMKSNPSVGIPSLDFSGEAQFSESAGFYEKPIQLKLSALSPNTKIYYTIDGSTPNQSSSSYSTPIEIHQNTVIKARTYSENKLAGKVITQSYLIKETFSLPVLSLTIDPKYLWDEKIGIYVEGEHYQKDVWETANYFQSWERPVHIEYFDENGKAEFEMSAGMKIHGRSTRNHAQKTLAIYARGKYGTSNIPYKLFGEKSPKKIKSFLLRSGGNDWGVTMMMDGVIHTLVNGKIDIDAQLYKPAIVYLNGKYWGIHNIREKINANYIENTHPKKEAEIDIIEANGIFSGKMEACHGNMDEYNEMIEFMEQNELSIKENYEVVKKWIDIDEFINYVATQVYIRNVDWPNSNQKFWKYRGEAGKLRWILFDTELSFKESHEFLKFDIIESMLAEDSDYYLTFPWSNFIIRKLFENEELRSEFIQRMAVYLSTIFEPTQVLTVFDSLKKNIEPDIPRHLQRWGGIKQSVIPFFETSSTKAAWEVNIEYFLGFAETRPAKLRASMLRCFDLKETVDLKLSVNDDKAGRIVLMGYPLKDPKFEGAVFSEVPIRLEAIPNEGYEFERWKGGDDESNCVLQLSKNKKLTAIFKKKE